MKEFENIELNQMKVVAQEIIKLGNETPIWVFEGNLGAGKTTLIKHLAQEFNIESQIQSPTFGYVNDYDGKIYHFDCYRLKSLEEALDLGFEEYIDSGKRCWIEWPEVIEPLLNLPFLKIQIGHKLNNTRNITVNLIE